VELTATTIEAEEARIRDAYARRHDGDRYAWSNPAYVFMMQARERQVLAMLARHGLARLADARILDIGCGAGQWLRDFVKWGARADHLTGVDLLEERLADARRMCPAGVTFVHGNAATLDLAPDSFDLVVQSTVFTSILDDEVRQLLAAAMRRAVRPGGSILWYDYFVDNPTNPDVRGVSREEIHRLFAGCAIDLHRITLAPPIARAIAPYSQLVCQMLEAIPLLRTHYLGVIRKPA
jgi:ubiquinone/menaquinone biosynthesis C-methylase UbiE